MGGVKMANKEKWTWHAEPPGQPIYRCVEDLRSGKRVEGQDALLEGEQIVLHCGFIPNKAHLATIKRYEENSEEKFLAENEGMVFPLGYCEERNCWVAWLQINKSAIRKEDKGQ
jgi:hypothetical protein